MNLYAYVGNDPLYRADPTGMWWDIPQPIVDFSVGVGDVAIGATLGLVTHSMAPKLALLSASMAVSLNPALT
jgi:hypothetical protein